MDDQRVVFSVQGREFIVVDAAVAFGDMPADLKVELIQYTADDIVTLMFLGELSPIIISTGTSTEERIEERKRGLQALGVEDVEAEIQAAVARFQAQEMPEKVQRALPFMTG